MLQTGLRPVDARVYTEEFRVYGLFHLREKTGTAWLLNTEDRPYLPMTQVRMFRTGIDDPPPDTDLMYETHFAAIPKSHISWVVGGSPDTTQEGYGRQPRKVFLVYPNFMLAGFFHVRPEVRLSDFIGQSMMSKPFQTLHDARLLKPGRPGQLLQDLEEQEAFDFVTVNLRFAGGVFDEPSPDAGRATRTAE